MTGHKSGDKGKSAVTKEKPAEREEKDVSEDSCRCKEVSRKTIPEMLKLMLSDLAFWRKVR